VIEINRIYSRYRLADTVVELNYRYSQLGKIQLQNSDVMLLHVDLMKVAFQETRRSWNFFWYGPIATRI
jgi:hypothetical protein